MKTTLLLFSWLISLTVFSQSSTLITPDGNSGIFSKNSTMVLFDPGVIQPPASGEGTRVMWIPTKSAFRAGTVNGTQWDAAKIGTWSTALGLNTTAGGRYSTAMGYNTTASGEASNAMGGSTTASGMYSTAMGSNTTASGGYSTAFGDHTIASGGFSTAMGSSTIAGGGYSTAMGIQSQTTSQGLASLAMGLQTTASGQISTAMGAYTIAGGFASTAMGIYTTAQAQASLVLGSYNIITGTANGWISTDPLFVIGNGTSLNARSNAMTVLKNGKVGIGTPTPDAPLHITQASGTSTTDSVPRAYFNTATGADIVQDVSASGAIIVHAQGNYWADGGGFVATSDARIKNILGRTDTADDLDKLRKIAITDYSYIDQVNNGSMLQKKVIAQQLKEVFPIAVNQHKGIIPNVYQTAQKVTVIGNTTQLFTSKAHNFATGDIVKLIVDKEGEKTLDVIVIDNHTFSVAQALNNPVFVYGKQVNDLLNVDYDAIAMLNVSATQELARQVDVLKNENASLKNEMDELKSQIATLRSLVLKTDNEKEAVGVRENKK